MADEDTPALPVSEEEKKEMLEKQQELERVKARVQGDLDRRTKLLEELAQLEAVNARLRLQNFTAKQKELERLKVAMEEAVEQKKPIEEKVRKAVVRLETELAVPTSSAIHREAMHRLLGQRRQLVLDASTLIREERAMVNWLMGSSAVRACENQSLGGQPLTLDRDIMDVARDWTRLYSSSTPHIVTDIADTLIANRGQFDREKKRLDKQPGSGHDIEAGENYGFETAEAVAQRANVQAWTPDEDKKVDRAGPNGGFVYPFDIPDSPRNIVIDPDSGMIKYATLDKLIERLTHDKRVDLNFRYVFMLTYHSFTTPRELLRKLSQRFFVPIPPNLTPEEIALIQTKKIGVIQMKVCSVLKNWLDEHYSDFIEDAEARQMLQESVEAMVTANSSAKFLAARLRKTSRMGAARSAVAADPNWPKSIHSGKSDVTLDSLSSLELARQLTLMLFERFRKIRPREFLAKGTSPYIKEIIQQQSERVSDWVVSEILSHENINKRARVLKFFVDVAHHCKELKNFATAFAIGGGLGRTEIFRLKRTKELLSAGTLGRLEGIQEIMDPTKAFAKFRQVLRDSLPPSIPYLGVFLQDLTFIKDGNKDQVNGMINFDKRWKLADSIRWIKERQQLAYQLRPVDAIQDFINKQLSGVVKRDEKELYALSKKIEPKLVDPQ